jgi:poly-gamma-glutamate capsule biosynthesis protein CapA/YwtB (metallophosphatase superfamily)
MNHLLPKKLAGTPRRVFAGMFVVLVTSAGAWCQNAISNPPPAVHRDQKVELAMKIREPFTVVAVGDMIEMMPFSKYDNPDIQFLMNLMRSADMTVANNENTVVDRTTYRGQIGHMEAPAVVADDWANMGIKMMTKANNHTWDLGEEGVWADFKELDRVGIVHVGVDTDLREARMARYYSTPKGIVGLVGVYAQNSAVTGGSEERISVTPEQLAQLRAMRESIIARQNEVPYPINATPDPEGIVTVFGLVFTTEPAVAEPNGANATPRTPSRTAQSNTLNLVTYNGVTSEQMAQLKAIAGDQGASNGDTLSAWGAYFKVAHGPGEYSYEMVPQDERDILREVKSGKQFSDFEIATIHWHQNRFAFQHYSFDHYPADFEIKFAHDCIDQGADAFYGHGVHTIKGVEIYKGKPIFYGVSNFVFQEQIFQDWRDDHGGPDRFSVRWTHAPLTGPIVGQGELDEDQNAWMEQPANMESILASMHYENGLLTEVRIYPLTLGGMARPGSQMGIPKRADPEDAKRILNEVVEFSKPFGTRIEIENGVGIIRVAHSSEDKPPSATTPLW